MSMQHLDQGLHNINTEHNEGGTMTDSEWWTYIDNCLAKSITNYGAITDIINGHKQPVFIDLIIKLTIARAYCNSRTSRIVTAQKILSVAEDLISKVKNWAYPLQIVGDKAEIRESSVSIPVEILEQKLLLHQGLLMLCFNKHPEARECFIKCLNCKTIYDARIRKECVEQL